MITGERCLVGEERTGVTDGVGHNLVIDEQPTTSGTSGIGVVAPSPGLDTTAIASKLHEIISLRLALGKCFAKDAWERIESGLKMECSNACIPGRLVSGMF
jgi:hypothetical protein